MKFELSQEKVWVDDKEKKELEKLGFKFVKENRLPYTSCGEWYHSGKNPKIEFNTLKELMNFIKKYGQIVLSEDEIEIYNDYRE
jgi:hypothetical protein